MTTGSIAFHPTVAAGQAHDVVDKVASFLNAARQAAMDGITWREFGELLVALLRVSIETLDHVSNLTGAEKKEIVLHSVGRLFDLVADKAIPLAVYPLWLLVRSPVRSFVLALASGAIEQLLPMVRAS
jgi:hypothetical protein